jgi:hypothetical protein
MSKTIGKFGYSIAKMKATDDLPFDPVTQIFLQNWTSTRDHSVIVSAQLMSEGEIGEYVKALKDDLDSVGRRAKVALAKAKTSTQKIVSDRNSN